MSQPSPFTVSGSRALPEDIRVVVKDTLQASKQSPAFFDAQSDGGFRRTSPRPAAIQPMKKNWWKKSTGASQEKLEQGIHRQSPPRHMAVG